MVGKISEMDPAVLTGAELVEVVQSGVNKRTTTGGIAALVPQKYRGLYLSLAALNAAVPTGSAGDYADVDSGAGSDVKRYIWDASDTAWVLGSGGLGGVSLAVVQTFTGAKTLGLSDINTYNVSQDATPQAISLPAQATVVWTADAEIHIERGAAGAVTITGAAGVQINGAVAGTFTLGAQYSVVTLKRKAANLWTLFGNAS
jgi:hypothetical protein